MIDVVRLDHLALESDQVFHHRNHVLRRQQAVARGDILLKGPVDLVSDGKKVYSIHGGTDAMTVGGTGDVLTGIAAGLVAKGYPLLEAAVKASQINKKAGEIVFKKKKYGLLASDLINEIPRQI